MSVGSLAFSPTDEDEDCNYLSQLEDLRASVLSGRVAMQARRDSLGQTWDRRELAGVDVQDVHGENVSQQSHGRPEFTLTTEQYRHCNRQDKILFVREI